MISSQLIRKIINWYVHYKKIVNKSDIIDLVSKVNNLNISDIDYSIKRMIDYMGTNLYKGERIEIRGFGSFSLIHINQESQETQRPERR